MLPCYARCVLSRLCCNEHSLLLKSYLSRIDRIENPSCSACSHPTEDSSHFILQCPATDSALLALWRLSDSLRPLVQALESCPASGAPWFSAIPPSLGRGQDINNRRKTAKFVCCVLGKAVDRIPLSLGGRQVAGSNSLAQRWPGARAHTHEQKERTSSCEDIKIVIKSSSKLPAAQHCTL